MDLFYLFPSLLKFTPEPRFLVEAESFIKQTVDVMNLKDYVIFFGKKNSSPPPLMS